MKLNWFSPLPPAPTDIAHFTIRVLPALRSHAQVTLWTNQKKWDADLGDNAEVRHYQIERLPWAELNRGDMTIYNIGNNPSHHGAIWEVSLRHPGIVILHDFQLHDLFYGLYRVRWHDLAGYQTQMEFYYGAQGSSAATECYLSNGRNIDEMNARYPLTPLALENALGALVHTRAAYESLDGTGLMPVAYAPLPFRPTHASTSSSSTTHTPYRLIVFGYLGRNRRLSNLLRALSSFPARESLRLDIYGHLAQGDEVRREIRALGLKHLVNVHGFVPEEELERALAASHLAINLRFPTVGEASGSQLRIWSHALPSLLTKVGWYASLPSDAVCFVRPEHEVEDIQMHLKAFLSQPERFAEMGRKGREILERDHAPDGYARALLELVESARSFRPLSSARGLAMRSGLEMAAWLASTEDERALIEVSEKKRALLYGREGGPHRRSIFRRAMRRSFWRRLLRRTQ